MAVMQELGLSRVCTGDPHFDQVGLECERVLQSESLTPVRHDGGGHSRLSHT